MFDGPAWNKCTVSVITASRAHILCLMLESYEAMLKSARAAPAANVAVLQQVGDLWGVETILKNMGGVLESGVLQPAEVCSSPSRELLPIWFDTCALSSRMDCCVV